MRGEEENHLAFLFRTLSHDTRNILSDAAIWAEKSLSILKSTGDKKEMETAIRRVLFLLDHTKTLLTQSRKAQDFNASIIACDDFHKNYIKEEGKYFSETAGDKIRLGWNFSATGSFFSDIHHLQRALNNLVSNAVKYGPDEGSIRIISSNIARDGKEFLQFAVSDQGSGIAPNELGKVFEAGYRTGSAKKSKTKGTGVGLGYVSYVAEQSGGRAFVESPGWDGFGTTFVIEIPKASGRETEKALEEKTRLKKLLILDCDNETMKFIKESFDSRTDNRLNVSASTKNIGQEKENLKDYGTVIYLGEASGEMTLELARKTGTIAVCLDEKSKNLHIADGRTAKSYRAVPATLRMLPDMLTFELEKLQENEAH